VALAPVLALAATAPSPRAACLEGWVAGLAFFVPLLRWLTHTMATFSRLTPVLAAGVLVLLAAYLALYWGAVSWAVARSRRLLGPGALWLAPVFWVGAELGRTHLLSGFPWGLLGYAPYRRLAIIQVAAWTGVYGVSALVVLVNAAVARAALGRRGRDLAVAAGVATVALGATILLGRATLPASATPTLPVAVVQGNIDQAVKWDAAFRGETLRLYAALTREAAPGSRLVLWPEAAVPAYLRFDHGVVQGLVALAGEVGVPILVGAPDALPTGASMRYLNSAFLLGGDGLRGRYDKMHLVPFGEYVPLKRLLFFVEAIAADIGDFTPGQTTTLFPLDGRTFGTVICYEVIFPDLFRRFVARGASFMTNITNDAWFGDSGGPLQHLAMVPLRAVENRVAVVRAANTGVSALVLPSGALDAELPLGTRGVLRGAVPVGGGGTFYSRFGDVFAYACTALAGVAVLAPALAGGRV
jgi:apolipoprotein N-acyltransferase